MRIFLAVMFGAVLLAADSGQDLFQKGLVKERTESDFRGAIKLYERVVKEHSSDRKLAAQALLRIGECEEALGSPEARSTYERVIREFDDQSESSAEAHKRLAALEGGASSALAARQLWTGKEIGGTVPFEIAPTSDGRSLVFVDWGSGDIGIRDMETGNIRRLGLGKKAPSGGLTDFVQFALFSPDQRQIAYTWHGPENGDYYDFRVISTQPGAKARVLIQNPELIYFKPFGWSRDGKSVLTLIWKKDGTTQISWVSAADGSFKTLKSLEWRDPEMVSLSPDGRWVAYDALGRQDSSDRDIFILAADGTSEVTAVRNPGIDHYPIWTPDGAHIVFTSDRSHNFGLYALAVQEGKPQGAPRLLKADVGGITLCGFARSGALYYLQPTGEQNVYLADLDSATGKLHAGAVPIGRTHIGMNRMPALSPDGKRVAYVSTWGAARGGLQTGPSTLVVKSLETDLEKDFSTGFELVATPEWFPDGRSLLVAVRDTRSLGASLYKVDIETGLFTLVVNARNGIRPNQVGLSRDGDTVYMPGWDRASSYSVFALSLSTGDLKTLYQAQYAVTAVALSPDGRTLAVETNGPILLMNTDGSGVRAFQHLSEPFASGIAWSSDGKRILFVRASRMQDDAELWRMPVEGGEPSPTGIHGPDLAEIHSGPDGAITYTAGSPKQAELWALEHLLPIPKAAK